MVQSLARFVTPIDHSRYQTVQPVKHELAEALMDTGDHDSNIILC
jgi:hypothetical protein